MKRYLLFAGDARPDGGWADFRGDYPSLDAVYRALADAPDHDWYQVVDGMKGEVLDETRYAEDADAEEEHAVEQMRVKKPKKRKAQDPADRPRSNQVRFGAGGRVPLDSDATP